MNWLEVLENAGLGIRFEDCTASNFEGGSPIKKKIKEFFTSDAWSLILSGNTGCGKTHLAVASFRVLWEKNIECRLFCFNDLCNLLRKNPSFLADCPYVFIDDLGAQVGTNWDKDLFSDFLNKRYNKMQKTFINTNLNVDELIKFLDARMVSRLKEGIFIASKAPDYRIKKYSKKSF